MEGPGMEEEIDPMDREEQQRHRRVLTEEGGAVILPSLAARSSTATRSPAARILLKSPTIRFSTARRFSAGGAHLVKSPVARSSTATRSPAARVNLVKSPVPRSSTATRSPAARVNLVKSPVPRSSTATRSPAARVNLVKSPVARSSTATRSPAEMRTLDPAITTYQGATEDIAMLDEDEEDGEEDEYDYGDEDEAARNDCVEGHIDPGMVDSQYLQGEEQRKFKSKVWSEFEKVQIGGVVAKGRCKHCNAEITARRGVGTSAMGKHLKRCKARKASRRFVDHLNASVRSPVVSLKNWKFNQKVSRRELVRMIVLHELPFSIVEYDGFRRFVSSLNPMFEMISRRVIKEDCLKTFEDQKQVLRNVLESSSSRVSLTMDMWTSNQTLGYMCITCHYLDDDWKMSKRILKFSFVKTPHTGVALFNVMLKSIQDWKIENKLSAVTLDNAANNGNMINLLKTNLLEKHMLLGKGKLFHQRCAAHVLNLICQAGFAVLNPIVSKIRESVKYIVGSPSRKEKFDEIVQQLSIKTKSNKRPAIDIPTRWNSTYTMVTRAAEFKRAFQSLAVQDPQYKCQPTPEDWERADLLCKLLKVFNDATKVVSGTLYPTSNLHFHEIWDVKVALEEDYGSDLEIIEMVTYMRRKFSKYWKLSWLTLSIPVVFDPRFKYKLLEFRFNQAFGSKAQSNLERVKKLVVQLFKEYSDLSASNEESAQQVGDIEMVTNENGRYADFDTYMSLSSHSSNEVPSELEMYLGKPPIPRSDKFDILSWWKNNSLEYPVLARIAKDILAIPVSTVASESAFSTGGRVISDFRSRLTPETVEALVCLQDWMRASESSKFKMEAIHDFITPVEQPECQSECPIEPVLENKKEMRWRKEGDEDRPVQQACNTASTCL
ncbi:hypothetical protein ACP70R_042399 [Stipagrostis hirtigluma subsp. patula]